MTSTNTTTPLSTAQQQEIIGQMDAEQQRSRKSAKKSLALCFCAVAFGTSLALAFPPSAIVAGMILGSGIASIAAGGEALGGFANAALLEKAKKDAGQETFVDKMAARTERLGDVDRYSRRLSMGLFALTLIAAAAGALFPPSAPLASVLGLMWMSAAACASFVNLAADDSRRSTKKISHAATTMAGDKGTAAVHTPGQESAPSLKTSSPSPDFAKAANENAPPAAPAAPSKTPAAPDPKPGR